MELDSHQCGTSSGSSAIARSMSTNGTINRNDTYLLLCMKYGMLCSLRALRPLSRAGEGSVEPHYTTNILVIAKRFLSLIRQFCSIGLASKDHCNLYKPMMLRQLRQKCSLA